MVESIPLYEVNDPVKQFIVDNIQKFSYFRDIHLREVSKIIPFLRVHFLKKNDIIYRKNEKSYNIFWIVKGKVEIKNNEFSKEIVQFDSFGEEALNRESDYFFDAKCLDDTVLLSLDTNVAYELLLNLSDKNLIVKIISKLTEKEKTKFQEHYKKITSVSDHKTLEITGWILTITLPFLYFFIDINFLKNNWNILMFNTIFIPVIILWIFRLIPEYVTSFFFISTILILGIAPQNVILKGFTDDSFFLALSIFALSSLTLTSGLAYRFVNYFLKLVPISIKSHSFVIFIFGLILTPILPSANGRISLIVPILKDIIKSLNLDKIKNSNKNNSINFLLTSAFIGATGLSTIFLSSKAIHFAIYGLLPMQIKERFSWSMWLYASFVVGFIMIAGIVFLLFLFFKDIEKPQTTKNSIYLQFQILGKMSLNEYAALGGLLFFMLGMLTINFHKISLPWVGLMILYTILTLEFIHPNELRKNIDWTFLIYLASLIGIIKTFSYIGLDHFFVSHLHWIGTYMKNQFYLFIFLLLIVVLILRFFIPTNAVVTILASILFPIAEVHGINSWVIGFILLLFSDMWFFPYQSTYYLQFENEMKDEVFFNPKSLLLINALSNLFRIAGVYLSLYYWKKMGIL